MAKNARFWIWWNGSPVKLTLGPGEETSVHRSWNNGEGWSYEAMSLRYDERGVIMRSDFTDGTDCDGRLSRTEDAECPVDMLLTNIYDPSVSFPDWQHVSAGQRDYAAEAAGLLMPLDPATSMVLAEVAVGIWGAVLLLTIGASKS